MDAGIASSNEACLAAGLAWLRAALAAQASGGSSAQGPMQPALPSAADGRPASRFFGSRTVQPALALLPAPDLPALRAAYEASLAVQPPSALADLARRLGLSPFERDMLLLAAAPELDTGMPALLAAAQGDTAKRAPSFALGMALFDAPAWDALSPARPLRALQLLEIHQVGAAPLLSASLRIDERIAAYLKGLNYLDERIAGHAEVVPGIDTLPPSQQRIADALARWLESDGHGQVQLTGRDRASKRDVLAQACRQAGRVLLAVVPGDLPGRADDVDAFVRLWVRETALLPLAMLVEQPGGDAEAVHDGHATTRMLRRLAGCVFVDTGHATAHDPGVATVDVAVPSAAERAQCWREALGDGIGPGDADDAAIARLAAEFKLSATAIRDIAQGLATTNDGGDDDEPAARAWRACVASTVAGLQDLAQPITPRAHLDDVRLPPHDKAQLERLVAHARQRAVVSSDYGFAAHDHRGLGLAALLHGESGTGKTMAAEAIANALSLSLFRVDLSAVVSKYIGETSKNLRRVFDAAEAGGAVLLFDEADAVFGKRSEVKDSHDRYANIDINYLLTRMENSTSVTLLATNMKHALDPAFLRRLRFIIGFPFPGMAERRDIWSGVFPPGARVEDLDFDRLARFALTGGSIFNTALASAHAAACDDAPIGMAHVLAAVRWELEKMGRPLGEHEFAIARARARRASA